ncbi:hypothetical protein Riv7116_1133 [Rivularia sp. PCC 7116]|uniref:hypothetical protein n=1 Tax=Rivularia sp. PCC 7116 TaxID=373994 RepID=UPI00029EE99E|nr:hypothetical protein [Rivularia sp. PCC 7116]AFY53706.1 hypothetical protein Riv7116_1133 [Rivularia sp. PCC 7116]
MTSRANQIQSMIADIDKLLTHKGKRLWGAISSQEEPRQVLERIRDFLVNEAQVSSETSSRAQLPPLVAKFMQEGNQNVDEPQRSPSSGSSDNQFAEFIEPLKAELKTLFEERANLVSEIRELEKKRLHDYSLAQQLATQEKIISEFMQVLRNRLEDDIDGGVALTVGGNSPNAAPRKALSAGNQIDSARVENLTQLTNDLDRRIVALDGTVNVVFEALQRNIHAYHDSLSQALARMHYKGVQGEQLLNGFIQNVANLSPAQVNQESLKQAIDETNVETIDAQSIESIELIDTNNQLKEDFETVEAVDSIETIETTETTDNNSDTKDNLVVIPDDTIGNIEFSQAQDNVDNTDNISNSSDSSDLETAISELEQNSTTEQLDGNDYLEVDFPEEVETEELTEQEIVTEPDAFDSPEKMQAVLSELKKSSSQTEELAADAFSENANEDEVDELYASLFDSENLTNPNPQTSPQQVINKAIDVENSPTTAILDSQLQQTEKEVVSREVVFEYIPSSSTDETSNDSENQSSVPDPWSNANKGLAENIETSQSTTQNLQQVNQTPVKTYKRKTQAATEDTVSTLTELLFEEATPPQVVTPTTETSQPQPEHQPPVAQETAQPIVENQPATSTEQSTQSEPAIQTTEKRPQLQEITLPTTSLRQPNQNEDTSTLNTPLETPLPQTEKTIPSEPENPSQDNSIALGNTEIPSINSSDTVWYLGLDIGTTGISAALLNRSNQIVHPIYWAQGNQPQGNSQNYRLPAEVYLPRTSINQNSTENPAEQNIYSAYLKPYLPISLPYKNISETSSTEVRQKWEPILQLNEFSAVPLVWIIRSLSKLLLTLKSDSNSTTLGLTATAIGIKQEQFSDIINNIAGIICTCPSNWSEQYRFNIRESLLISQLVEHPQQVFFVEEAIASLLGELEGANGEIVKLLQQENSSPIVASNSELTGNTLVINIGASATEMALVELPEDLQDLSHNDFMLHGFTCGGKAMEQDIITQLLLPEKWRTSRNNKSLDSSNDDNPLHWKPNIPGLEQVRFSSLGLEHLELPRAGEPDISQRISLQQRLESSPLGKALLDAAIALKLILQHQESFTIELADQKWDLQRRDLESKVFVPFVRRINRELNKLLRTQGIPTEAINMVILSGGVSSIAAISRWLRQKLPSATIIQEKYLNENGTPACSRVATGLCLLPLHPLVLEIPRQQYTDYFLFTELLRLIPEKATTFGEVVQLFESRGINTRTCQQRLLAFLEGEIPPGLIPSNQDMQWLNKSSVENSHYKVISASPLFDKQGSLSYRPNLRQLKYLRDYLDAIKTSAHQSLEEPYIVNFAVGVSK